MKQFLATVHVYPTDEKQMDDYFKTQRLKFEHIPTNETGI